MPAPVPELEIVRFSIVTFGVRTKSVSCSVIVPLALGVITPVAPFDPLSVR